MQRDVPSLVRVNAKRLGKVHRALRKRLSLTQRDVGRAAHVDRNKISEMENGELSRMTVPELERCFGSMDARIDFRAEWNGAALDRLLDEGHASLAGSLIGELRRLGWVVQVEVSFSIGRERGWIDILAWHNASRTLLIVEIKTELASVEGLLRPLDVKVRLGPRLAPQRFGWDPMFVAKIVVLPEDRTARRTVARHAAMLDAVLPARNREVRRWLANPTGDLAGLVFLTSAQTVGTKRNPSAIKRVRRPRSAAN